MRVLNQPALELLARELDTVTDFTRYLTRRERMVVSVVSCRSRASMTFSATTSCREEPESMISRAPAAVNGSKARG